MKKTDARSCVLSAVRRVSLAYKGISDRSISPQDVGSAAVVGLIAAINFMVFNRRTGRHD
jgi:hypothetical protein